MPDQCALTVSEKAINKRRNFGLFDFITPVGQERRCRFLEQFDDMKPIKRNLDKMKSDQSKINKAMFEPLLKEPCTTFLKTLKEQEGLFQISSGLWLV